MPIDRCSDREHAWRDARRIAQAPALAAACTCLVLCGVAARARADVKPLAARVGVDERVGSRLPLDVELTDHEGRHHELGDYFSAGKPVLLTLAYYHCPGLCDVSLRELATTLRKLDWAPGDDYRVLTISIDPSDGPEAAAAKRSNVLLLMKAGSLGEWPFFVATEIQIERLTAALGYRYDFDAPTKQYAHPAVSVVLTPDGRIARYVYGPTIELRGLRLALREARLGHGGITSAIDRTILSCFRYDPSTRRYELVILGVMRGGAALIALALAAGVLVMVRRGRRRTWS